MDEWVTQMLRQTDAKVFKKYSQMKLQMKRDAANHLNREAGESPSQAGLIRRIQNELVLIRLSVIY